MVLVPELGAEELERQALRRAVDVAQRDQALVLVEEQVGAVERERLLDVDQQLTRQPLEVALVEKLLAELRQIPALAELGPVLQPFERGADPLACRDQQAADHQHRCHRQQVAQQSSRLRDAVLDQQAQEREAGKPEQDGETVGGDVARDHRDVPQPEAQDRVGEGERHHRQRQHREHLDRLGAFETEPPGDQIERDEGDVAARHAERDPQQLSSRLAPLSDQQPIEQDEGRDQRERDEEQQLGAVESLEHVGHLGAVGRAEQVAAVVGDEVPLQRGEERRGQVEERQQAADPGARLEVHREGEEEVERQRRQQEARQLLDHEQGLAGVVGQELVARSGDQDEERARYRAPQVEEQALARLLAQDGVEADQQVEPADHGLDQVGPVDLEPRPEVAHGDDLVAALHHDLGRGLLAQRFESGRDTPHRVAADEEQSIATPQVGVDGGIDLRDHHPVQPAPQRDPRRAEGLELALDADPARDQDQCRKRAREREDQLPSKGGGHGRARPEGRGSQSCFAGSMPNRHFLEPARNAQFWPS